MFNIFQEKIDLDENRKLSWKAENLPNRLMGQYGKIGNTILLAS